MTVNETDGIKKYLFALVLELCDATSCSHEEHHCITYMNFIVIYFPGYPLGGERTGNDTSSFRVSMGNYQSVCIEDFTNEDSVKELIKVRIDAIDAVSNDELHKRLSKTMKKHNIKY